MNLASLGSQRGPAHACLSLQGMTAGCARVVKEPRAQTPAAGHGFTRRFAPCFAPCFEPTVTRAHTTGHAFIGRFAPCFDLTVTRAQTAAPSTCCTQRPVSRCTRPACTRVMIVTMHNHEQTTANEPGGRAVSACVPSANCVQRRIGHQHHQPVVCWHKPLANTTDVVKDWRYLVLVIFSSCGEFAGLLANGKVPVSIPCGTERQMPVWMRHAAFHDMHPPTRTHAHTYSHAHVQAQLARCESMFALNR